MLYGIHEGSYAIHVLFVDVEFSCYKQSHLIHVTNTTTFDKRILIRVLSNALSKAAAAAANAKRFLASYAAAKAAAASNAATASASVIGFCQ